MHLGFTFLCGVRRSFASANPLQAFEHCARNRFQLGLIVGGASARAATGGRRGFLRAVWAENRDIADDAVIRDVLAANGFDPAIADKGLFVGAEQYGRNLEDAVAAGVFGAPFYVVRETGQKFWGQDRLTFLADHLATI